MFGFITDFYYLKRDKKITEYIRDENLIDLIVLLSKGANPNNRYINGFDIPLDNAINLYTQKATHDRYLTIEVLLKHGANPNKYYLSYPAPIYRVTVKSKVYDLLADYGAEFNVNARGY